MQQFSWWQQVDFIPQQDRMWSVGDSGPEIEAFQKKLKSAGYSLSIDGDFGPGTERVVRLYQRDHNLVADGRIGPKTEWLLNLEKPNPKFLSHYDIVEAATLLQLPVPRVYAVNEVESRGSGFLNDATRPVILYERHIMYRQLRAAGIDPSQWVSEYPNVVNMNTGGYQGGSKEYDRLEVAKSINPRCAFESASWGLYQIMGFHWQSLAYASVDAYVASNYRSEGEQLKNFCKFVIGNPSIHQALQAGDYASFARQYNGPGFEKNQYDQRIAQAEVKHTKALTELKLVA